MARAISARAIVGCAARDKEGPGLSLQLPSGQRTAAASQNDLGALDDLGALGVDLCHDAALPSPFIKACFDFGFSASFSLFNSPSKVL